MKSVASGERHGFISGHSLAELFSALTQMPVRPRIHPLEAKRLVEENASSHFDVVDLSREDYLRTIDRVSMLGIAGPRIYDALLLRCAEKCGAERIFTLNSRHFLSLAAPETAALICEP